MKTIAKCFAITGSVCTFILFIACNKESNLHSSASIPSGKSKLSIYMMDGPVAMDSVFIDIRQLAVEIDTATNQNSPDNNFQWDFGYFGWGRNWNNKSVIWDTLAIRPGLYNLMDLRNGTDTLLASGLYTAGKILKIRITLGSDNTVYMDSVTKYPLVVFGPEPFFDINVRRENVSSVTNNQFELWLDFNLEKSIFFWDGQFLLKPVITVFNDNNTARVEGFIMPPGASPVLELYNSADTVYAVPGWAGNYLVRGVPAGTYSLSVTGHHGYNDTTINNIVVNASGTTKVPTVLLHQ